MQQQAPFLRPTVNTVFTLLPTMFIRLLTLFSRLQTSLDIAMSHGFMYESTTQEGVMFHLIGALSQYGKLGIVRIASSHERAKMLFEKTIATLDYECRQTALRI